MSDERLNSPNARLLVDPVNVDKASSTRPLPHTSTDLSDAPSVPEEEDAPVEEDNMTFHVVALVVVIVVAVFVIFMLYIRAIAQRKKRLLEETRKRISETVVTAGSTKSIFSSGRSSSSTANRFSEPQKKKAKKMSAVDETELKSFVRTGPLVMQSALTGEVKHALQDSQSASLQEPVTFHPSMNEIAIIGTDFDRILGRRTGEEAEGSTAADAKKKERKTSKKTEKRASLDECVTQPSPPISHTSKWFPIAEDRNGKSKEKKKVENLEKASKKPVLPTSDRDDKQQKDESGSRNSPELPIFANVVDIIKAAQNAKTEARSCTKPEDAEGKTPVVLNDYRKVEVEIVPKKEVQTLATEQPQEMKTAVAQLVKQEQRLDKTAKDESESSDKLDKKSDKIEKKYVLVHATQADDDESSTGSSNDSHPRSHDTFDYSD